MEAGRRLDEERPEMVAPSCPADKIRAAEKERPVLGSRELNISFGQRVFFDKLLLTYGADVMITIFDIFSKTNVIIKYLQKLAVV
jgi:hypothetical protein